jgi:hypothetical protein
MTFLDICMLCIIMYKTVHTRFFFLNLLIKKKNAQLIGGKLDKNRYNKPQENNTTSKQPENKEPTTPRSPRCK